MVGRIGLGPVFAFEWHVAARRWRSYAIRSLFVGGLLAGLMVVALSDQNRKPGTNLRAQAWLGQSFYYAIVGVQLALVMLVAPAATAGAVCLEKARGTLLHLFVTDLSNMEIVLGKLAARLVPTWMLVGCVLPVMALGTLLGGIDPVALTGAFLITMGVAVLGCSLALTFSVWGTKTHEVLMATYAVFILWLLAHPIAGQLRGWTGWSLLPLEWAAASDPFRLAFAPYVRPGSVSLGQAVAFLAGALAVSAALAAVCVWRLRPVTLRSWDRTPRWAWSLPRFWRRLPGPDLDANPVLWREWHRHRPSRGMQVIWAVFLGLAGIFSLAAVATGGRGGFSAWVNGLQVAIGLLLVSVSASTSLTEERVRGSLDVLLATPLSTRTIVWGKWLGAFRMVPPLCILPAVVVALPVANGLMSRSLNWEPVTSLLGGAAIVGLVLAQGAAITGLGLLLATSFEKPGRAVAWCVAAHTLMTVGWLFLCVLLLPGGQDGEGPMMASSFFGVGNLTFWLEQSLQGGARTHVVAWGIIWVIAYSLAAVILLRFLFLVFDRRMGRIEGWKGHYRPRAPRGAGLPLLDPDAAVYVEDDPRVIARLEAASRWERDSERAETSS